MGVDTSLQATPTRYPLGVAGSRYAAMRLLDQHDDEDQVAMDARGPGEKVAAGAGYATLICG